VIRIEKVQSKKLKEPSKKKCVLLVARQHASESPSSFICESLLRNLLSENKEWDSMLKSYKFVIIPMANPDGVIHGNSRTNIKGYDINRLW
jgi:murein tripeptide amidase MpaA